MYRKCDNKIERKLKGEEGGGEEERRRRREGREGRSVDVMTGDSSC